MKRTLKSLLNGAVVLGASACASSGTLFPEGHAHNYEFRTMTQEDNIPYNLERAVIFGDQFYVQRTNTESDSTSLNFSFLPFDEVSRVLDLNSGEIKLEFGESYVPTMVQVQDHQGDRWADEIRLRINFSEQTGVNGVKANILSQEQLTRRAGADAVHNHGFSLVTSQDDATYGIRTMQIFGERYFFPHVSDNKTQDPGKLPFYLIPVRSAQIRIENSDGSVTIRNENNIYRPVDPSFEEQAIASITRYSGRDLFNSLAACPDCSYFQSSNGKWVSQHPDGRIVILDNEQAAQVRRHLPTNTPAQAIELTAD